MLNEISGVTELWRRQSGTDSGEMSNLSPDDIAAQARYARLIALHGLVGFFGLAVMCPLAICIVSIGKSHGPKAAILHKRLQVYVVFPMLIICVTLAYAAGISTPKETPLDAHKVFGLIMVASLVIAWVTGDYTFTKYFSPKPAQPRKKSPMSIWLHVQAGLGFLFSPATQVLSGLAEWQTHVGLPLPWYVPIVVWSTLAFFPSLLILHWLGRGTHRMARQGKSFRMAFFPPSAPREAPVDPESRSLRDNADCFDIDVDVEEPKRPRLKSIPPVGLLARRDSRDRTPSSPRSVSSPAAPSFQTLKSNATVPARSPPPPFTPPLSR
ncbi:uncharacterized protein JCM15063_000051 [Sporobolomyces koalae]|uniref:uncharacterized protein n=1 Tax=Sporobolomyces koalae TaxID=500713 RepID=UPI00317566DB